MQQEEEEELKDSFLAQLYVLANVTPRPATPRHFHIIGGGRKRDSTIFMDKNSVSRTRGAQPLFHALFGVKNTIAGSLVGPASQETGLRG